jgi:hypothetical protein
MLPFSPKHTQRCPICDSSITIEMDSPWNSYRVCVRNGHIQGDDGSPAPLAGVMFYPARG